MPELRKPLRSDAWLYLQVSTEVRHMLRDFAREQRKDPTSSEKVLWQALRHKQLESRKFRRQQPIGPFIVDFFCPSERLVIEVDGPIHQHQQEADAYRQSLIEALGLRFLRFTDNEVEQNLDVVVATIRASFRFDPNDPDSFSLDK